MTCKTITCLFTTNSHFAAKAI